MSYLQAVDISQWQGVIDWTRVPAPIAVIKMSGGDSGLYLDSKANANYYGAKNAGKAVGMYHFAGGQDATNEADFFIAACSPLAEDDVLCLDWEIPHNDPVGWCKTFTNRVHDRTGVWPLIYMNLATLNAYDWSPVLQNCGLWLAAWNNNPEATLTNKLYVMHQYSSNGTVAGISGRVDTDAWFGTVEQFKKYGYHAPVTTVPEPVPTPTPVIPPATTTGTNIDGVMPPVVTVPTTPPVVVTSPPVTTTKEDALDVLTRSAKTLVAVYAAFVTADGFNILGISTAAQLKVTALATLVTALWNTVLKIRASVQ